MSNQDAAGQAAGYYYQVRLALVYALRSHHRSLDGAIAIELDDDISILDEDKVKNLFQAKHSISGHSQITDHDPALWRTIAIWCSQQGSEHAQEKRVRLALLSNRSSASDAAVSFLEDNPDRDHVKACENLNKSAKFRIIKILKKTENYFWIYLTKSKKNCFLMFISFSMKTYPVLHWK